MTKMNITDKSITQDQLDKINSQFNYVHIYWRGWTVKSRGGVLDWLKSLWWGDGFTLEEAIEEARRLDRFISNQNTTLIDGN